MLKKTIFAASSDETRYVLNGVLWVGSQSFLDMVATDGRRLARIRRKCDLGGKEFRAIVPTKVLAEVVRLLSAQEGKDETAESLSVSVTENQIAFQFGTTTLLSRLLEGNFPNYEQVIPQKKNQQIALKTKEFSAITKRAALCAADRGGLVQYTFKKGALQAFSSSQNLEFNDEIPLDYTADNFVISFNPQFVLDGLKNIDAEEIRLSVTTSTNPALIETADDTDYQYVVMPIRS
jgi:DNA polymerase-3 subunit beta